MNLVQYIMDQGVPRDAAEELAEQAAKNPHRCGATHRGRFIKLRPQTDVASVNEMLATGNTPGCMTDSVFLEGRCNGNQFTGQEYLGDYYKRECERHGGSTTGRVYLSSIARFPGDPLAWVSGRGDVQRSLELQGKGAGDGGCVTVKPRPVDQEPAAPIPIADHVVENAVARELEGQTVTKKEYTRKKEEVKDRLTPRWKKK